MLVTDRHATYVDGTTGGAGHSEEICRRLEDRGRLLCFDADADALVAARDRLSAFASQTLFVHANVRRLQAELQRLSIPHVAGLLLDLGVSSHQFDTVERGFSFRGDERLDMRMDRRQELTAWDLVNTLPEADLATLLREYGEEPRARGIAKWIVMARPVETTGALGAIVERVVGGRFLNKSMARVFQALRIRVNDELGALRDVLRQSLEAVSPGGRIVVIAYHSLEDRIVKEFFRTEAAETIRSSHPLIPDTPRIARVEIITPHPVMPAEEETERNPRARSARMRVARVKAAS